MNRRQKLFLTALVVACAAVVSSLALAALVNPSEDNDKIGVVATFYPLAYLAEAIGGEKISVKTLIPQNTEVHAWEPSTADILEADEARVLLYNGAGLEPWFEADIMPSLNLEGKIVVDTTAGLGLAEGGDPHTWINPYLALHQAEAVFHAIVQADPGNGSYYEERWDDLRGRLGQLDDEYSSRLSNKTKDAVFVGHAAYGYLAERYDFQQYGIIGLAADEEPSASIIVSLINLMKEHDTYVVFVDPLYREDYAETLKSSLEADTGKTVEILHLYLLLGELEGLDYLGQMEANLDNLVTGLVGP